MLSPYQYHYHTSTRLKLFTIGKTMAKRSRIVASCRYALPGILIILDHSPTNQFKVIESLFVWRGTKNRPEPSLLVSRSLGCHLETQGQSSFDRQPQFIFEGVIMCYIELQAMMFGRILGPITRWIHFLFRRMEKLWRSRQSFPESSRLVAVYPV